LGSEAAEAGPAERGERRSKGEGPPVRQPPTRNARDDMMDDWSRFGGGRGG